MRTLENRLEKAYHRFNAQRAATGQLRDSVDNLRKERLAFNEVLRKLNASLDGHRKQAAALLHSSHTAIEARDKVRSLRSIRNHSLTDAAWEYVRSQGLAL